MRDFSTKAPTLAQTLADSLDSDLQDRTANAGWTSVVSVSAKEGVINLSYDSFQESDIFDSEYGAPRVSPNAVIRPFLESAQKDIQVAIEQQAMDFLFSEGILP